MEEKKRRQHYVFQAYLKAWTNSDGKLWCMRDGKKFPTITMNVAQKRDFYRLKPITDAELKFLNSFWRRGEEDARKALMEHAQSIRFLFGWQEQIKRLKQVMTDRFGGEDKIPPEMADEIRLMEEKTDIGINNAEEDYLSDIEGETKKWIEAFQNEDMEFIKSMDRFDLFYGLSVQYFRTHAIKERWKSVFGEVLDAPEFERLQIPREQIDLDSIAQLVFWDVQHSVAFALTKKGVHITLLVNKTGIPFVTSDQPVINLCADYKDLSAQTEDLIFYYPLSPTAAITVNDQNAEERLELKTEDVDRYNRALIDASYENVFADREEIFERYSK